MDMQTAFNKSYLGLIKQGKPAFNKLEDACKYRMRDGSHIIKCAIGHLIPKKDYIPSFENKEADRIWNSLPLGIQELPVAFVMDLQNCHDKWATKYATFSGWKKDMRAIAEKWKLKVPKQNRKAA